MPGIVARIKPKLRPNAPEGGLIVSSPPAALDPTTITGMVLWLQPSEVFMYDDDAGSLGIDLPAGGSAPVGYWEDSSGAGNHFNQTTSALRPVVHQGVQNGQNGMLFDAAEYFRNDGFAAHLDGADAAFTWVVVFRDLSDSLDGSGGFFAGASTASNERYIYAYSSITAGSSGFVKKSDDGVLAAASMLFAPDSTRARILTLRCNGTTIDVWLNQVRLGTAVACNVNAITLNTFAIGAMIRNLLVSFQFTGYMYEIRAWDNAIADADVTANIDDLQSKFGI